MVESSTSSTSLALDVCFVAGWNGDPAYQVQRCFGRLAEKSFQCSIPTCPGLRRRIVLCDRCARKQCPFCQAAIARVDVISVTDRLPSLASVSSRAEPWPRTARQVTISEQVCRHPSCTKRISIPTGLIWVVLGKNGQQLQQLRSFSGLQSVTLETTLQEWSDFEGTFQDLVIIGSGRAVRAVSDLVKDLMYTTRHWHAMPEQKLLHLDADRIIALKFMRVDWERCPASFAAYDGDRDYYSIVAACAPDREPGASAFACSTSSISVGLHMDDLEEAFHQGIAECPTGADIHLEARFGVSLFFDVTLSTGKECVPADLLRPFASSRGFRTQFSPQLRSSAHERIEKELKRRGFSRVGSSHELDIDVVEMDAGQLSQYKVAMSRESSTTDSFEIPKILRICKVKGAASPPETRLFGRHFQADICVVSFVGPAVGLRIDVKSRGLVPESRLSNRLRESLSQAGARCDADVLESGDRNGCSIEVVRHLDEEIWSDGSLEVKMRQVRQTARQMPVMTFAWEAEVGMPELQTSVNNGASSDVRGPLFRKFVARAHDFARAVNFRKI